MCDRSRGRSGCTRRRTTARANGPFRVWISGASRCRLPRDVAASGIPNTIATHRFPGTARLLCSCQVIGPRLAVAILHIPARATTRDGSHPVQHHDCHTPLDEPPHTNPTQSKLAQPSSAHPTPAAPDPHSPTWGQDPQGAGLALRATVAILHRTTSPATWRGTTPAPTHDCHKGTSRAVPHPLAGSSRQGIHHHA